MKFNLPYLLAALIITLGACFVWSSGAIEVGEEYTLEINEPCTPENCECMACHKEV